LAAALAAARTALYFAGQVGQGDVVWSGARAEARARASRWLTEARLLTVAIQLYHTLARVLMVVSLVAAASFAGHASIFWGIIVPSVIGLVLSEAFARLFARKYPVSALSILDKLISVVHGTTAPITKQLNAANIRWRTALSGRRTAEEALAQVIELAAAASEPAEKDVVQGIVNFGVLQVRDLMHSRNEIGAMSTSLNFDEVIAFVNECGYSRIPVYTHSIDHISGVLYIKDLLPFFEHGKDFPWMNVVRPGYFVWANKRIDALLKDFQEKRVHVAIVRDDAGNTAGLITLEDLIEVVIREINEQRDDVGDQGYLRIDDRTYVFNGKSSIRDVFRLLDTEHPILREPTEFESLEDFIVEINDELPAEGDEVSYDHFTFVVEAVENKRIKRVRVNVHAQA
jgi:CBS domain containing-hemolysin-like protein